MFRGRPMHLRRVIHLVALSLIVATLYLSLRSYPDSGYPTFDTIPHRPEPPSSSDGRLGGSDTGASIGIGITDDEQTPIRKPAPAAPTPGFGIPPYLAEDDRIPDSGTARCASDISHLQSMQLRLTDEIVYHRRCIKTVWSEEVNRDKVASIKEPLLVDQPAEIKLSQCAAAEPVPCEPLELHVPPPYSMEPYDHMIFGVASTAGRLFESVQPFAHWLSGTNAKLIGIITDADDEAAAYLNTLYLAHGVTAEFKRVANSSHAVWQTHFTMIRDMLEASTANTRWFGVLDDDTFVPSIHELSRALDKYDTSKPYYIGALSEDFNANKRYGYMAFGGAGAFLSRPMATQLVPLIDMCIETVRIDTGDGLLKECIARHTHTKLTLMPGLWQQDIVDDASGFFEGDPKPVLTVHHWKSWYWDPIEQMASVSHWCGSCWLQRWRFGTDTVLSNGYSISVYKKGHKRINLNRKEGTWRHATSSFFDFAMGPLRLKVPNGEKKQFKVVRSGMVKNSGASGRTKGTFVQTYVYRGNEALGGRDEVIDLVWQ